MESLGKFESSNSFVIEPFFYPNLPLLDKKFTLIHDTVDYGNLREGRKNRSSVYNWLAFEETEFCKKAREYFGFINAVIIRFEKNTMIDWHKDDVRKCALNFLLNEVTDCITLIKEQKEGWTFRVTEIPYFLRKPVLLNTELDHLHANYNKNLDRYLLTLTFGKTPTYFDVKEYLTKYTCHTYEFG